MVDSNNSNNDSDINESKHMKNESTFLILDKHDNNNENNDERDL